MTTLIITVLVAIFFLMGILKGKQKNKTEKSSISNLNISCQRQNETVISSEHSTQNAISYWLFLLA